MNEKPAIFFEENKGKIFETAKYIAEKENTDIARKFEELQAQYINQDGSFHRELIVDKSISIACFLNRIRHSEVENIVCIGIINEKAINLFSERGTQFSCNMDIDRIIKTTALYKCDFYIIHNHPFVFRASPSLADIKAAEQIITMTTLLAKEGVNINMLDFAIVTDFDYWSMTQELSQQIT